MDLNLLERPSIIGLVSVVCSWISVGRANLLIMGSLRLSTEDCEKNALMKADFYRLRMPMKR